MIRYGKHSDKDIFIKLFLELEETQSDSPTPIDNTVEYYPDTTLFYCNEEGEIVGFIVYMICHYEYVKQCGITGLYISPEYRGNGYSKMLLAYVEGVANMLQCDEIVLGVSSNNTPAMSLYGAFGYNEFHISMRKKLK